MRAAGQAGYSRCLPPSSILSSSPWGILRHSQARRNISFVQRVLGVLQGDLPGGGAQESSRKNSNQMSEAPLTAPFLYRRSAAVFSPQARTGMGAWMQASGDFSTLLSWLYLHNVKK